MADENPFAEPTQEEIAAAEEAPLAVEDEVEAPEAPQEAQEAQEAPQEAAEPTQEAQEAEDHTVPPSRLREETKRRRQIESELQEMREWKAGLEARFAQAQALEQQRPVEEGPPPDPDDDIFGAVKHTNEKLAQLEAEAQRRAVEDQQRLQFAQFATKVQNDAAEFKREKPDFDEAYQYIRVVKAQELERMGVPPGEIAGRLQNDEIQMAQQAYSQGRNPAEITYDLAKYYGYGRQQPAAEKPAEQKIEKIAATQEANQSLTQAGGSAAAGEMTLEAIANMSDNDFSKWFAKPGNAAKLDKLQGAQ